MTATVAYVATGVLVVGAILIATIVVAGRRPSVSPRVEHRGRIVSDPICDASGLVVGARWVWRCSCLSYGEAATRDEAHDWFETHRHARLEKATSGPLRSRMTVLSRTPSSPTGTRPAVCDGSCPPIPSNCRARWAAATSVLSTSQDAIRG